MKVEKAKQEDIERIAELINSDPEHLLRRSAEEIREYLDNFWVIKDQGKIIATASFENYSPRIAEIRSLIVDPNYRSQGLGRLLMNELIKLAGKDQEVFVVTSHVKWFKTFGFKPALKEREILFLKGK